MTTEEISRSIKKMDVQISEIHKNNELLNTLSDNLEILNRMNNVNTIIENNKVDHINSEITNLNPNYDAMFHSITKYSEHLLKAIDLALKEDESNF